MKRKSKHAIAYIDGSSSGNPGPAGIGVVLLIKEGSVTEEIVISKFIRYATNNQAEYRALIEALEVAQAQGIKDITIYTDSKLVVKQISGEYRVKNKNIKGLYERAMRLLEQFASASVKHIPREMNREVDRLAREAANQKCVVKESITL